MGNGRAKNIEIKWEEKKTRVRKKDGRKKTKMG